MTGRRLSLLWSSAPAWASLSSPQVVAGHSATACISLRGCLLALASVKRLTPCSCFAVTLGMFDDDKTLGEESEALLDGGGGGNGTEGGRCHPVMHVCQHKTHCVKVMWQLWLSKASATVTSMLHMQTRRRAALGKGASRRAAGLPSTSWCRCACWLLTPCLASAQA